MNGRIRVVQPTIGFGFFIRILKMIRKPLIKHPVLTTSCTPLPMGVGRGALAPLDFENCSKNSFFCSFEWEKTNFTTFGPPLEKFWINPFVAPLEKILPRPMLVPEFFFLIWVQILGNDKRGFLRKLVFTF